MTKSLDRQSILQDHIEITLDYLKRDSVRERIGTAVTDALIEIATERTYVPDIENGLISCSDEEGSIPVIPLLPDDPPVMSISFGRKFGPIQRPPLNKATANSVMNYFATGLKGIALRHNVTVRPNAYDEPYVLSHELSHACFEEIHDGKVTPHSEILQRRFSGYILVNEPLLKERLAVEEKVNYAQIDRAILIEDFEDKLRSTERELSCIGEDSDYFEWSMKVANWIKGNDMATETAHVYGVSIVTAANERFGVDKDGVTNTEQEIYRIFGIA